MNHSERKAVGAGAVTKDGQPLAIDQISSTVEEVLASTSFLDIHTHLYPPAFLVQD